MENQRGGPMTYGSLFAGVGGFDLGFDAAGLDCRWQVEIDATARSVLSRHWPTVPKFGDVRSVAPADLAPVDVLVAGFPCTDISVAGARAGLSGERSGLFYEVIRIARALRPEWVVVENVAGLLNGFDEVTDGQCECGYVAADPPARGGRACPRCGRADRSGRRYWLAAVVREFRAAGYLGAWRVLDARWFGVPQRRRRLFGVFARGPAGARRACDVLALPASLCRHPAEGRSERPPAPTPLADRLGTRGRKARVEECVPLAFNSKQSGTDADQLSPALMAMGHADGKQNAGGQVAVLTPDGTLRRLTPLENERLMGWPDQHTRWRADGTEIADGPRYRMIGNGVVKPCAEWIGRQLVGCES